MISSSEKIRRYGIGEMIYKINDDYYVRALQKSDLDGQYLEWFENQEVCKYNSHGKYPKTREYFEEYYANLNGDGQCVWAICHKKDGHIGNVSLQKISFINRSAEFAVLIGDSKHWGKNVSYMTSMVLIKHGFEKLNIRKIFCSTAETNHGMIKLAERIGMQQEGCRKAHLYLEGRWVNVLEFGLFSEGFYQKCL